ncbi:MAG: DNA repair protein RecN [Microcystis aeruginosa Ma_SC_T_19800800_S464]|jgi:DNA repair protein RecN (Recombination protein N)|uniref:DNA repair protein RecN n=1 Tax=Microcystis aeruginosa Ma_SC_T_19800800_S464 TaxID=2486257 RepID=A0A552DI62_MICAE|nr:MAG: DNA repair protein RecN [Microcystis aeruginosa Ma_SC_T_19800800_S464]
MLSCLQIENFTLIDRLELTFGSGLNVLTGETGAGKSIILDAIDIVLGGKVNHRVIRQGSQQSTLEATFSLTPELIAWLESQEIDLLEDNSLTISRELVITNNSLRSRSRINGVVANRQQMAQIRDFLVEITAQGQTVQLMDANRQRELLDLYGGESLLRQREKVATAYLNWQESKSVLNNRLQSEQNRLQRLDLLEYQLKELESANLTAADELEQLEQERNRLSHAVDLQNSSYQVYQLLYQNDRDQPAVADLLGKAENILTNMMVYDSSLEPILEMVRSALNQIVEAGQEINVYGDSLEADPERLNEIEERIVQLKRICRKYGPSLAEALDYYQKLQQELAELTGEGQSIEELEKICQQQEKIYRETSTLLTFLRQETASQLEKQLVQQLKPLAMEKVIFVCRIAPGNPSSLGVDQVVFYFSPNPGEKIQPLSSTASGGEMSRFLLALKSCFSQSQSAAATLIFDEIDAGVSGKVAQAIADKLDQLGQQYQVLCVTHQPLVAALADHHFRVYKQMIAEDNSTNLSEIRTVVRVNSLDNRQTRREELAQLTGGNSAADALAFAESLLDKAAAKKQQDLTLKLTD